MTVEDLLNYIDEKSNATEKANEIYRILSNGLNVVNQSWNNLKKSKKVKNHFCKFFNK